MPPAPTGSIAKYKSEEIHFHKQEYCIIFEQPLQENESSLAVIFVPFFK